MGTLVKSELQLTGNFSYTEGQYRANGNFSADSEGHATSISAGNISKGDHTIGNAFIQYQNGQPVPTISVTDYSEYMGVMTVVSGLIAAFAAQVDNSEQE